MSPSAPRDPAPPRWLEAIARPALSQVMHRVVRTEPPRPVLGAAIRAFSRAWGVDLAEAARPVEDYRSFQDFFTRTLKDGLRPIEADPALVPSPSDGRLSAFGPLAEGRLVQAKGVEYSLDALLGGADDAAPYRHGSYAVVYLAPNDYHRVHCPWRGTLTHWRYLPGALYPVNKVGLRHVPGLFARNERIVGHFDCEFGRAALIMVGATFVGHMRVRFTDLATNTGAPASGRVVAEAPLAFERGEELGVFEMGSTVVLLFDRDDLELAGAPRSHGLGARVRVGAPVLRLRGED
jgi:phosphatidylserine decarboxylase